MAKKEDVCNCDTCSQSETPCRFDCSLDEACDGCRESYLDQWEEETMYKLSIGEI